MKLILHPNTTLNPTFNDFCSLKKFNPLNRIPLKCTHLQIIIVDVTFHLMLEIWPSRENCPKGHKDTKQRH